MKIQRDQTWRPITITLESPEEAALFAALLGPLSDFCAEEITGADHHNFSIQKTHDELSQAATSEGISMDSVRAAYTQYVRRHVGFYGGLGSSSVSFYGR